jgi:Fatty acid cis/trans isomerase (CTI)
MISQVFRVSLFILIYGFLASCGSEKESVTLKQADIDYDILLRGGDKNISYINEVRPVLEKRCVVCHGCYDASCQLKLTSIEGIRRGANPEKVYNAERILAANPTRLFIDAETEEEWRSKGFHPVLNKREDMLINNLRHSVLYKMLRLKQLNPQPRVGMMDDNFDLSLGRDQTCPTIEEFDEYAKEFPQQGMPFAMPNLSDNEYHVLVKWISQGLPDDSRDVLPSTTVSQVKKWEAFLNQSSLKHQLFGRYLYEHLTLGHLHFKGAHDREFFRLVRSYTPPGKPVKEIATVRAFDDPGTDTFYYRLRYYGSSIVDKNHIVYELSDKRMDRYKELFINTDHVVSKLPNYTPKVVANPIKAFSDLPVKSRYLFLLDDAKFFLDGFIKGPSCRGQVALNVIEDNFWVFFSDPDKIEVNNSDHYLDEMSKELNLPNEKTNGLNFFSIWTNYWGRQHRYMMSRQERFKAMDKVDLDQAMEFIWDGKGSMDKTNRALTIFRHFDSATVMRGLLGDYPETSWVIDYPVLERIHYLLVAGYDVYGNIGHNYNARLYMDFLRMEAENTFLAFIPSSHRKKIRDSWYEGIRDVGQLVFSQPMEWLDVDVVQSYKTENPQLELYKKLENRMQDSVHDMDPINRCESEKCKKAHKLTHIEKQMQRITEIKGRHLDVFPDLSLLKVMSDKQDSIYTLIRNKSYKNISFLMADVSDRDKSLDTLSVYKGIMGAYPNFFFVVHEKEVSHFADELLKIKNRDDYERFVGVYGVRRTSSNFWKHADSFNKHYAKQDPVNYGIFDLYRYKNR